MKKFFEKVTIQIDSETTLTVCEIDMLEMSRGAEYLEFHPYSEYRNMWFTINDEMIDVSNPTQKQRIFKTYYDALYAECVRQAIAEVHQAGYASQIALDSILRICDGDKS